VLVVDDDRAIRELIHDVLEGPELEVSLAHDGKQALSFLEWDLYNVVIIDLRLPDMDGLALLQQIKERTPDTEAVILSAYADLPSAVEALRIGACDYLRKPLEDIGLLQKTIERALERQELVLANRYLMAELRRANRELQRQRRRELRRLEEVGLALAGALQRDEVLEVLQRAVSAALSCDLLALYLFSVELGGPSLRVHSQWPLPDNLLEALHEVAREAAAPEDAVERAVANVEVTVLSAQPATAPPALGTIIPSRLATRGTCLGLVTVAAARAEAFAPEEVQLLRILCNQTAVALENARLFQQAQFLATRDGLTGLLNHRSFYRRLEEEIARSKRHNVPLSLVIIDTDCLKRVNDQYGHLTGDEMLRVLARLIASGVRRGDVVARYGGDEFAILLPHTTPEAALALCERLRRRIESHQFVAGEQIEQIGASFGVAGYDPLVDAEDTVEIVRRADEALYRAKTAGRNRIEVAERTSVEAEW
jgi:diguanylate cyclase (GGDEF)-like protein